MAWFEQWYKKERFFTTKNRKWFIYLTKKKITKPKKNFNSCSLLYQKRSQNLPKKQNTIPATPKLEQPTNQLGSYKHRQVAEKALNQLLIASKTEDSTPSSHTAATTRKASSFLTEKIQAYKKTTKPTSHTQTGSSNLEGSPLHSPKLGVRH